MTETGGTIRKIVRFPLSRLLLAALSLAIALIARDVVANGLLSLRERVPPDVPEGVEVLRLDHVEARLRQPPLEVDDLLRPHRVVGGGEAAAPVVRPERLGEAVREDLDAAVRDQLEAQPVAVTGFQAGAEDVGVAPVLVPVEENVDADERLRAARRRRSSCSSTAGR